MNVNSVIYSITCAIIWCSCSKGQCDRYIRFFADGGFEYHPVMNEHSFMVAFENCVAGFDDFEYTMGYNAHKAVTNGPGPGGWGFAWWKQRRPNYNSICNMNVNVSEAELCDSENCDAFTDMQFVHPSMDEMCPSTISNAYVAFAYFTMYGYYQNQCDLSGEQVIYQLECECNNTYRLTFYEYYKKNKICLFETTFFANQTYMETINCVNQCTDNYAEGINDYVDEALIEDFECTNQCTNDSLIRQTTTTSTEVTEDAVDVDEELQQWFIIGIVFVCLFVVACLMSSYMAYKLYIDDNDKLYTDDKIIEKNEFKGLTDDIEATEATQ